MENVIPEDKLVRLIGFLNLLTKFRDGDSSSFKALTREYDEYANAWDCSLGSKALSTLYETVSRNISPSGKVLDAGCGTGRHIESLLEWCKPLELTAIDISEVMLDVSHTKCRHLSGVSFVQGDLLSLPFPDNTFDAVVAIWSLETLSDPARAVNEFLRVIKPSGIIAYTFIQIPQHPEFVEDVVEDTLLQVGWELGDLLNPERLPFHHCENSTYRSFHNGLISFVTLKKCCAVRAQLLPQFMERE